MDKIKPNMERHCYYDDKGYGPAICYDYGYTDANSGYCKRYKKPLKIETKVDTVDAVGRFMGQIHRFPKRLDECKV